MATSIGRIDTQRALKLFADWTDRIAAGELPAAQPQRPQGRERNVVITQWDFSDPKHYLHDITATDKRKPTLNANGLIYGAVENSTDLDPGARPGQSQGLDRSRCRCAIPTRRSSKNDPMSPSPYWGEEPIWDSQTSTHNPMYDEKGRVWCTSRVGPPPNPDFCKQGLRPSVGQGVPAGDLHPAPVDARSQDRQDHADPHLLPDPPPRVRRGRQQHAVAERGRTGQRRARLARHARSSRRPATRRSRRAGRRSSSTPTATASATPGSSRTSRSIRPRTSASSARSTASASTRRTARSGARS